MKPEKIEIGKRDQQNLRKWAREDRMTPERYLWLMFGSERVRRRQIDARRTLEKTGSTKFHQTRIEFQQVPDFAEEEDT